MKAVSIGRGTQSQTTQDNDSHQTTASKPGSRAAQTCPPRDPSRVRRADYGRD